MVVRENITHSTMSLFFFHIPVVGKKKNLWFHFHMPECIGLLPCDWPLRYMWWQATGQVYTLKWSVSVRCLRSEWIKFWRCKMAHFKSVHSFKNITNHTISISLILNTNNDKAIRIQLIFLPCHCVMQIICSVTATAPLVNNTAFNAICNTTPPLMKP